LIKTKEILNNQVNAVLDKHPNLKNFTVVSANELPKSHMFHDRVQLARYIDLCWDHTYTRKDGKKEARFLYTPGYLEWILDPPFGNLDVTPVLMDKHGKVVGVLFNTKRDYWFEGRNGYITGIQSGMSIHPKYTRQGLFQLGIFSAHDQMIQNGYDAYLTWFDGKKSQIGTSLGTFRRKDACLHFFKNFTMYASAFDFNEVVSATNLQFYEKLAIRFRSGIPDKRSMNVEIVDLNDRLIPQITDMLNGLRYKADYVRSWSEDEVKKTFDFTPSTCKDHRTISTIGVQDGKVVALCYGYRIPLKDKKISYTYFIDGIDFDDSLSLVDKKTFMFESYKKARDQFHCTNAVYLNNSHAGNSELEKFVFLLCARFLPMDREIVYGTVPFTERANLSTQVELNNIYMDHK
jgi:hypothetical protein